MKQPGLQRCWKFRISITSIAATAMENNIVLVSRNIKHFKAVKELQLKTFKP